MEGATACFLTDAQLHRAASLTHERSGHFWAKSLLLWPVLTHATFTEINMSVPTLTRPWTYMSTTLTHKHKATERPQNLP